MHIERLYERYKEPTKYEINSFGWKYGVRNYVDDVFDHLLDIIYDVNGISEKSFKKLDDTKKYLETYFDNNQEILLEIDKMNDKRFQYTAEFLYDKYFKNNNILSI